MQFKTDENLPVEVVELFRNHGYDCLSVHEQSLSGSEDARIITVCQNEARVLITLDLGFGDIRRYPPADYPGIIVLRLIRQDKQQVMHLITKIIPHLESVPIDHRLWIVEENRIRIRS